MPDPARAVLITRPEPGASETADRVAALGYRPVIAPVLRIAPRPPVLPARVQAILATSANAFCPGLPDAPILAVGDATAARARALGHHNVASAGRDATALADLTRQRCDPAAGAILLLSGGGQGASLAASLRAAGFRVIRRVTYDAVPAQALPAETPAGLGGHALFFSPQSARIFVRLLRKTLPDPAVTTTIALAISPATATSLAPLPWRSIRVASAPNQDDLLALLR